MDGAWDDAVVSTVVADVQTHVFTRKFGFAFTAPCSDIYAWEGLWVHELIE